MPPKKSDARASSGRAKSKEPAVAAAAPPPDELPPPLELPVCWPLWSDTDIEAEKWTDPGGKASAKEKVKWPFEEPTGQLSMPPSLAPLVCDWKRLAELLPQPAESGGDVAEAAIPLLVNPDRFRRVKSLYPQTPADASFLRRKRMRIVETEKEPFTSLVTPNTRILSSELARHLICCLDLLQTEGTDYDAHHTRPWELIFPQGKDKIPTYNAGGKYCVKLFIQGDWRKVTVSDEMPLDEYGQVLAIRSSMQDWWACILSKAVYQAAAQWYVRPGSGVAEFGDGSIMQLLTGWLPQRFLTTPACTHAVGMTMSKYCQVPPAKNKLEPDEQPVPPAEEQAPPSSGRKSSKPSKRSRAKSAVPSPGSEHLYPPLPPTKNVLVLASYADDHADVGLPDTLGHCVRVLSCQYVPAMLSSHASGEGTPAVDTETDPNQWVLELSSSLALFTGRLGYNDASKSWRTSMQMALGVSREAEALLQKNTLALHAKQLPHAPFRWRMLLADFCEIFRSVEVLHKPSNFDYCQAAEGTQDKLFKSSPAPDSDQQASPAPGEPWLLHVDSAEPMEVVLALSVGPAAAPRYLLESPAASKLPAMSTGDSVEEDAETASKPGSSDVPAATTSAKWTGPERDPEVGSLVLEPYSWQSAVLQQAVASLRTSSCSTQSISLPPGRHVFQVLVDCPNTCHVHVLAHKPVTLAEPSVVLQLLAMPSIRLQSHAVTTARSIGLLVSHEQLVASEILQKLVATHANDLGIQASEMLRFWDAVLWSLEATLSTTWNDVGPAWKTIVGELKHLTQSQYKQLHPRDAPSKAKLTGEPLGENDAATVIQRSVRGYLGRKAVHSIREERVKPCRQAAVKSWEAIAENIVDFGVLVFRRYFDASPSAIKLFSFGDDEAQHAVTREFSASLGEHAAGEPFIFFRDTVVFKAPTTANLHLWVETPEGVSIVYRLRVFDNETQEELAFSANQPQPHVYQPTLAGYTLVAVGCVLGRHPLPAGLAWGVRVVSHPEFPLTDTELQPELKVTTAPPMVDEVGPLKPIKHDVMMRKSIKLQDHDQLLTALFSVSPEASQCRVTLSLRHNGQLVHSNTGVGFASLPLVVIPKQAEVAEASQAPEGALEKSPCKPDEHVKDSQSDATDEDALSPLPEPSATWTLVGSVAGQLPEIEAEPAKEAKGKRAKSASKKSVPTVSGPAWKLAVASFNELHLDSDTARDEEIAAIKSAWEAADPGRREKAKALRDKHREGDESTDAQNVPMPPNDSGNVLFDNVQRQAEALKAAQLKKYKAQREAAKQRRREELEARNAHKVQLIADLRDSVASVRNEGAKVLAARQQFRQELLDEQARLAAAEAAKLEAEAAAQEALQARPKSRKGKKK
eukprot:m.265787 g.265787  ORF g.265787 m.265787 type:complete len:1368 (+) comp19266_c0_seq2:129-4232(+)